MSSFEFLHGKTITGVDKTPSGRLIFPPGCEVIPVEQRLQLDLLRAKNTIKWLSSMVIDDFGYNYNWETSQGVHVGVSYVNRSGRGVRQFMSIRSFELLYYSLKGLVSYVEANEKEKSGVLK